MRSLPVILLLALVAGAAWADTDPALITKLRHGGFVLYLRHASTDFGQNDDGMRNFDDCANQRNLTDKGRDEARALGAEVKRLAIPIGPVYASPFCRTRETANSPSAGTSAPTKRAAVRPTPTIRHATRR